VAQLELRSDGMHVVAAIAVRWERQRCAGGLQVPQPGAEREDIHLPAGIVDVVLAVHAVAGDAQKIA
jgi:hypothetical protein